MRLFGFSLAVLFITAQAGLAAPGDQWVLGIRHFNQGTGTFTENVGAGYNGPHSSGNPSYFGNSYQHSGTQGDASRIYWELSGNAINSGRSVPSSVQLYKIDYWGVAQQSGRNDFQVIESQIRGAGGENWPYDSEIPWVGASGQNHQWIRVPRDPVGSSPAQPIVLNAWNATGDGPQAPESADYNAEEFGIYMWLKAGSWLYAKWDFPFVINRTWSTLRLTQITDTAGTPGDFDFDGDVDAADYVLWRKGNIDGQNGYADWRTNFGVQAGAANGTAQSAVPEPSTSLLVIGAVLGLLPRLRRNARQARRQIR